MSSQTYSLENMPGINPKLLDSVVYAYPSLDSAREGGSGGGTGFIASVPYREGKGEHYYVVSNYHVVRNGGCVPSLVETQVMASGNPLTRQPRSMG